MFHSLYLPFSVIKVQSDPSVLKCAPEYARSDPVVVMEAAKSAVSMSMESHAENLMHFDVVFSQIHRHMH